MLERLCSLYALASINEDAGLVPGAQPDLRRPGEGDRRPGQRAVRRAASAGAGAGRGPRRPGSLAGGGVPVRLSRQPVPDPGSCRAAVDVPIAPGLVAVTATVPFRQPRAGGAGWAHGFLGAIRLVADPAPRGGTVGHRARTHHRVSVWVANLACRQGPARHGRQCVPTMLALGWVEIGAQRAGGRRAGGRHLAAPPAVGARRGVGDPRHGAALGLVAARPPVRPVRHGQPRRRRSPARDPSRRAAVGDARRRRPGRDPARARWRLLLWHRPRPVVDERRGPRRG